MPRIEIQVDAGLHERMAVVPAVDWSRVAAAAFEARLAAIASRPEERGLDEMVDRLRASRLSSRDVQYQRGVEIGKRWARDDAEWEELERMFAGAESGMVPTSDLAARLWRVIHGGDSEPDAAELGFWLDATGLGLQAGPQEVAGFADGALNLFRAVRDRVLASPI